MPRGGRRPGAGRPKGSNKERRDEIAALIARAARVKDGRAWLIALMVRHAKGSGPGAPQAARWLADQVWGRAPVAIEGEIDLNLKNQVYRCVGDDGKDDLPGGGD